ncbi:Uncharacterised protein [Vibrio cholerae]|nr:Uncharacterised protein [Vibrio cholerae]
MTTFFSLSGVIFTTFCSTFCSEMPSATPYSEMTGCSTAATEYSSR